MKKSIPICAPIIDQQGDISAAGNIIAERGSPTVYLIHRCDIRADAVNQPLTEYIRKD